MRQFGHFCTGLYSLVHNTSRIDGAISKELLIRDEDVQVLHGFKTVAQAQAYLHSPLFTQDVVAELKPYLNRAPEVRIYDAM